MWGPILRGCAPGDSSGGPVVKTPCFQCRGHGFNPWLGNLRSQRPHGAREKKEKEQIMCSRLATQGSVSRKRLDAGRPGSLGSQ